jgi:hypothetical protein
MTVVRCREWAVGAVGVDEDAQDIRDWGRVPELAVQRSPVADNDRDDGERSFLGRTDHHLSERLVAAEEPQHLQPCWMSYCLKLCCLSLRRL